MDYAQTIEFLFNSFPMFEKTGGMAYKPGLERISTLCNYFGDPQKKIKTIHVAGTNGKGSSSHLIASVLQSSGYKTGLYSSPHLREFTERIKINGIEISKQEITDFISQNLDYFKNFNASFFEITTLMAFYFFEKEKVDIAVIETGLGGRLDSTNIIVPEISLITNISYDHTQYLGDTIEKIAFEKAGIIKSNVTVVIGEKQAETSTVFESIAASKNALFIYADDFCTLNQVRFTQSGMEADCMVGEKFIIEKLICGLGGMYQEKNSKGVLTVLTLLSERGWKIEEENIREGFLKVIVNTGLKGRWQILQQHPMVVCDTAHNVAGIRYVTEQLKTLSYQNLYVVLGMMKDKEIDKILTLLPKTAWYFYTQPSLARALDSVVLFEKATVAGLKGEIINDVSEALETAKKRAGREDLIYV
ncbi:MAG TPA: folylpolyglutamate synthase/dihydrofolate synthase family protein, partial [Cytophagaceae bacterium]|nr:folylpolyglutamate synthase/dihydrofolate synthase family protein [Cytophagaceae bacterium]